MADYSRRNFLGKASVAVLGAGPGLLAYSKGRGNHPSDPGLAAGHAPQIPSPLELKTDSSSSPKSRGARENEGWEVQPYVEYEWRNPRLKETDLESYLKKNYLPSLPTREVPSIEFKPPVEELGEFIRYGFARRAEKGLIAEIRYIDSMLEFKRLHLIEGGSMDLVFVQKIGIAENGKLMLNKAYVAMFRPTDNEALPYDSGHWWDEKEFKMMLEKSREALPQSRPEEKKPLKMKEDSTAIRLG